MTSSLPFLIPQSQGLEAGTTHACSPSNGGLCFISLLSTGTGIQNHNFLTRRLADTPEGPAWNRLGIPGSESCLAGLDRDQYKSILLKETRFV